VSDWWRPFGEERAPTRITVNKAPEPLPETSDTAATLAAIEAAKPVPRYQAPEPLQPSVYDTKAYIMPVKAAQQRQLQVMQQRQQARDRVVMQMLRMGWPR
jgi:hypothetical protein